MKQTLHFACMLSFWSGDLIFVCKQDTCLNWHLFTCQFCIVFHK